MVEFMMTTPLVGFEALPDQKQEEMYKDYRHVCVCVLLQTPHPPFHAPCDVFYSPISPLFLILTLRAERIGIRIKLRTSTTTTVIS